MFLSFTFAVPALAVLCVSASTAAKPTLKFGSEKTFKIVQFSDIQDNHNLDPRTSAAMAKILDAEKPDLVVLTGDTVSSGEMDTPAQLKTAIEKLVQPMETRRIPWAHMMGNHDTDGLGKIGVTKAQMMAMYRAYGHNVNPPDPKGVSGVGNALLKVHGSKGGKAIFGVWMLDSNAYAPDEIGGQKLDSYDWIHSDQVAWYQQTSRAAEREVGRKLPSLMFFHICLPEFGLLAASGKIVGERNEPECPAQINGGMFAAVLDRGDVLGIYVGHDHTNTYEGSWFGVRLGYGGSIGYHSYGIDSKDEKVRNRIRGARVFEVAEGNPGKFESRYVYAGE